VNTAVASRIAAASGDAGALLALAIELAQENARLAGHAAALEEAETERKAKQNARVRKHRNVTSRDETLQSVTERCVTGEAEDSPPAPMVSLINPSFPPPPPLPAERTIVRTPRAGPHSPGVEAVVSHYVGRFPKRRPGDRERRLIAKHLGTYTAEELCEAIDGNADDDWAKDKGKHELTWTLRDNGQIDTYRAKAERTEVKLDGNGWFAAS
jgi:hypothetical protein